MECFGQRIARVQLGRLVLYIMICVCQSGLWARSNPKYNWRFNSGVDFVRATCASNEVVVSGSCGTDLSRPLDTVGVDPANNAWACGDWGNTATVYAGALCMSK